ncbi:DUF4232 domain-containing protein [Streptomyces sp. ISL-43]|uniref:DUF4232 domain-containing protein n=1 Tax=Streptomyces sp. ISL-43 TaxID=2819183 RepID=UPI001BE6E6BD|nr:DUF4232 domain-containing protein [Streptomyces sp. ISL-43]MBT2449183.1 DUF4232 domain-containing protein [Streptomyces sp. ISL-43]
MSVKRWGRAVAGVGALVGTAVMVAGCDAPPAPASAPGPTSSAGVRTTQDPRAGGCPEGGVRLLEGLGNAAMGLRVESVQLLNCGSRPYELEGYPEIALLDAANAPVEVAVGHGAAGITASPTGLDSPPGKVTVLPGQAAEVGLVWRNLVTESSAPAVEGWVLAVTPRPGAPRLELRLTRPVDLGNTGKLGIGPWTAAGH